MKSSNKELFNPTDNTWTNIEKMNKKRLFHTATVLLNGQVLITGGSPDAETSDKATELYDPIQQTWIQTDNMNSERFYHTASLLTNGSVLVAGGFSQNVEPVKTSELFI